MAEESDLEKTEQASPRRLEKAREEGDRHEALDIDDSLSCWIRDLLTSTQENEDEIIRTICP